VWVGIGVRSVEGGEVYGVRSVEGGEREERGGVHQIGAKGPPSPFMLQRRYASLLFTPFL